MVDKTGRDAEIRTRDLTHPKRARYQAAPRPVTLLKYVLKCLIVKSSRARGSGLNLECGDLSPLWPAEARRRGFINKPFVDTCCDKSQRPKRRQVVALQIRAPATRSVARLFLRCSSFFGLLLKESENFA